MENILLICNTSYIITQDSIEKGKRKR